MRKSELNTALRDEPVNGITIALSKGRIFDETLPLLAAAGIVPLENPETSRKLIIPAPTADVRVVIVRATDVPTYVQYGAADLGVAGKDVLLEHGGDGLYQPLDLKIAKCRMMVAVPAGFDYERRCARARASRWPPSTSRSPRTLRGQGRARRPDQALRLDGTGAPGRPGRRHRRPRVHRQHAEGQQPGRGRGHHDISSRLIVNQAALKLKREHRAADSRRLRQRGGRS
jgi:ATP phosphoribosyltransferase